MSLAKSIHMVDSPDIAVGVQSIEQIKESGFSEYKQYLRGVEIEFFNSLKNEKRRVEWIAGRIAAKKAYSKFCEKMNICKSDNVSVMNNKDRAPYFKEFPNLHLSITHCHEYAVSAVSYNSVGIDLEHIDSGSPHLIKYFFTDKESKSITKESTSDEEIKASIAKYWTRKEAVSKFLKLGMKLNFRSIDTTSDYLSIDKNSNEFIKLISYKLNDYYLSIAS